jgi:hypothetical protein
VFIRGTNTKQLEVTKTAGRNTKANIFQKGSAGFETTRDLRQKAVRCFEWARKPTCTLVSHTVCTSNEQVYVGTNSRQQYPI